MCFHPSHLAQAYPHLRDNPFPPDEVMIAPRLGDLARLRRVRDRIDREHAQPLDVEALARGAHMPAGYLSRDFRLAYGASPYGYLRSRRAHVKAFGLS